MALAHSRGVGGKGHDLVAHLRDVALGARSFAERIRPDDLDLASQAEWAGWLHDLGKYRDEFQDYLLGRRPSSYETRHAVFGAAYAQAAGLSSAITAAICGHHSGLPNRPDLKQQCDDPDHRALASRLWQRLQADRGDGVSWPIAVSDVLKSKPRDGLKASIADVMRSRMLFSCLVDADYLDTEQHFTGVGRTSRPLEPDFLFDRLEAYVQRLSDLAEPSPIRQARADLYRNCVAAAEGDFGLFQLTAPTGSGKTLAMLAFALRHAARHELDRIIIVLPFLAIIEQNARVYREALNAVNDPGLLIEHHSAVRTQGGDDDPEESPDEARLQMKRATENWDAPVIVTTAVQFLESLFANRPSKCRKLHNIARSVVIFDEVQTLPFTLLDPILGAVRELRKSYGVSLLFGSATQPRLEKAHFLPNGLLPDESREIVRDRPTLFSIFRRARLELPCLQGPWTWDDLHMRLAEHSQALVIVNVRKHAQQLFDHLKDAGAPGLFHLSSTMCAAHREAKLGRKDAPEPGTIYHALKSAKPCVVISTQVVESGVDISFPVVFRALAPLDAIIQAAGRCDREGQLTRAAGGQPAGRVIVFQPADPATPGGFYEAATLATLRPLSAFAAEPQCLLDNPDLFAEYHQNLIRKGTPDNTASKILAAQEYLDFPEIHRLFKIIDDSSTSVLVKYGEAETILEEIYEGKREFNFRHLRAMQRYTVSLYPNWLVRLGPDLRPLVNREGAPLFLDAAYDDEVGLRVIELPIEQFCP